MAGYFIFETKSFGEIYPMDIGDPFQFFRLLVDNGFLDSIVEETNEYAEQNFLPVDHLTSRKLLRGDHYRQLNCIFMGFLKDCFSFVQRIVESRTLGCCR